MRRILMITLILAILTGTAQAAEYEAPPVPDSVAGMVPEEADSFAQGLWNVIRECTKQWNPALSEAAEVCLQLIAIVLLTGLVSGFAGGKAAKTVELASCMAAGVTLLQPSASFLALGTETVESMSQYGKLLIPVMTSALAAQGGTTTSAGLYAATAFFDSVLGSILSGVVNPMVCLFLGLSIANAAIGEPVLAKMRDFVKWLMSWILKITLYVFTGFLTITGVVSGSTDAAAMKAAKLTISGAVPVVGSILSDASEAVLVGAGLMRNAVGISGLLTIIALFLSPFIRIGVQYILLKGTAAVCGSISKGSAFHLMEDFATAMGLILGMVATETVLLLVSTVCFMKGVS